MTNPTNDSNGSDLHTFLVTCVSEFDARITLPALLGHFDIAALFQAQPGAVMAIYTVNPAMTAQVKKLLESTKIVVSFTFE